MTPLELELAERIDSQDATIRALTAKLAAADAREKLLIAERDCAFERGARAQACTENELRDKVALLMQPIPEVHGDFPWQMMRLWCLSRDEEKREQRQQAARLAEFERLAREVVKRDLGYPMNAYQEETRDKVRALAAALGKGT
jgi:hypothetical protein